MFLVGLVFLLAMKTAMPIPTAIMITATIINPPAPVVGGGVADVSAFVAMYAVNVGSCSTL